MFLILFGCTHCLICTPNGWDICLICSKKNWGSSWLRVWHVNILWQSVSSGMPFSWLLSSLALSLVIQCIFCTFVRDSSRLCKLRIWNHIIRKKSHPRPEEMLRYFRFILRTQLSHNLAANCNRWNQSWSGRLLRQEVFQCLNFKTKKCPSNPLADEILPITPLLVHSEWKNRSKYWPPPKFFFCC